MSHLSPSHYPAGQRSVWPHQGHGAVGAEQGAHHGHLPRDCGYPEPHHAGSGPGGLLPQSHLRYQTTDPSMVQTHTLSSPQRLLQHKESFQCTFIMIYLWVKHETWSTFESQFVVLKVHLRLGTLTNLTSLCTLVSQICQSLGYKGSKAVALWINSFFNYTLMQIFCLKINF